jgi:hypothetical protein
MPMSLRVDSAAAVGVGSANEDGKRKIDDSMASDLSGEQELPSLRSSDRPMSRSTGPSKGRFRLWS